VGINAPNYGAMLISIIVVAGLLFGWRGATIMTGLCLLTNLVLVILELQGYLSSKSLLPDSVVVLFGQAIFFPQIAAFVGLAVHNLDHAIKQAHLQLEERRIVERKLHASEEEIRTLIENISEGIALFNLDGTIAYVSPVGLQMFGYKAYDTNMAEIFSIMHPNDVTGAQELVTLLRAAPDESVRREFRVRHKGGRWVWVEAMAKYLPNHPAANSVLVNFRDITERKRIEEVNDALHSLSDQLSATTTLRGLARIVAAHCKRLFDHDSFRFDLYEENTHMRTPIYAEDTPEGGDEAVDVQTSGDACLPGAIRMVFTGEKVLINREEGSLEDGLSPWGFSERRSRSMMFAPVRREGHCIGVIYNHSYTPDFYNEQDLELFQILADQCGATLARVMAEEELRKLYSGLEQRVIARTEELESTNRELETFAYSVSHDLKAPLRAIDGYSRLLLTDYTQKLDEDGCLYLESIHKATKYMNELIDDLLTYSRVQQQAIKKSHVNLPALMDEILADKKDEIRERGVELRMDLACTDIITGEEGFSQALRNLIDNAFKFSRGVQTPQIEIGSRIEGNYCIISVKDNGIGFNMQYHDRIFEVFQRLHSSEDYPGTGIGLALVHKAMERLGGRVWATSAAGQGATFYLELPMDNEKEISAYRE
jgi:PAS domain S-box-containing protein